MEDFRNEERKSYTVAPVPAKPSLWNTFTSAVKTVVAPVVNALQPKKNVGGGGKPMLALAKQEGDPPPPEEKDCGILWLKCVGEWIGNNVKSWFEPKTPVSTPDISAIQTAAVQSALTQLAPTATPIFAPTATPIIMPTAMLSILVKACGLGSPNPADIGLACVGEDQAASQMTAWDNETFSGYQIFPSQYPGYRTNDPNDIESPDKNTNIGKSAQAKQMDAMIGNIPNVAIAGYSAGVHSALFTAELRAEKNLKTDLILIGLPIDSQLPDFPNPFSPNIAFDPKGIGMSEDDFIKRVKALAEQGNHILLIDDIPYSKYKEGFIDSDGTPYKNVTYYSYPQDHTMIDDIPYIAEQAHGWLSNGLSTGNYTLP